MRVVTEPEIGSSIYASPGERIQDCDPAQVVDLLRQHAWVHFSGFAPTIEEFASFTRRFGPCATPREIHYPPGGVALGFHAEDSYNPWRPDALWFLCLAAGSDGGTPTGVVDGVHLLDTMDEGWRDFCREHTLSFHRDWPACSWQNTGGGVTRSETTAFLDTLPGLTYTFLPDGTLRTRYDTPLVVRTQAGQESFSNTVLQAVRDHDYYGMTLTGGAPFPEGLVSHVEKLALDQELPIGWADGDVAVIDNYRLMHRRGEYAGQDRDLRALHGEELYGTVLPRAATPAAQTLKVMLQGEEELR
jgi:Taurine catabolism dioxygenase TauD, TfdA family